MRFIPGDHQEHSRIRLERDIDNNIPSPPSMSSPDVSSVDFARHNEHFSHLDSDFYSRHEDSLALDPELGQTMSTAAHHASALTLSAGLRGRSCTTGRVSQEFDPERPLQDMLNSRIADGISIFDATKSKSRNEVHTLLLFAALPDISRRRARCPRLTLSL